MPTCTITKTYLNGNILTQSDLDTAVDSITTFLNTTKIDSNNIQTGGIIGSNLANSTITSSQLAAASVGTAQIASSAVTTAAIGPLAVTQPQIALGAVGPLQLADLGQQISASCGNYTVVSGTPVDVTNLTVTITTKGRPVFLCIIGFSSSFSSSFSLGSVATNTGAITVAFVRDTTITGVYQYTALVQGSGTNVTIQSGAIMHVDIVLAGTYVYKVQVQGSGVLNVTQGKLLAFEL